MKGSALPMKKKKKKKYLKKKYFKKFQILFRLCHPEATPEWLQKIQPIRSIQLARGIIYKNILFYYYIDYRYTWFNHDYRGRTRILETTLKLLTINFLQKFS